MTENDLSEPEQLLEKVTKPQDVFCHFGWGGSGSASRTDRALQEKNLEISQETIRTAKALGCKKFLFSGSQAEYGMHRDLITEETACEPKSLYGEAKLAMCEKGEKLCGELGLRYIHARIFSAYGPGDHPWTLVESCLDAFLNNREMSLGACTQNWNFLYIDDLARGMAALCEAEETTFEGISNPVFNFGGAETKVLKDFVEEIHTLCGGKGETRYNTRGENAEGLINLMPSIEKLKAVTGWKPEVDFKTGITRMISLRKRTV